MLQPAFRQQNSVLTWNLSTRSVYFGIEELGIASQAGGMYCFGIGAREYKTTLLKLCPCTIKSRSTTTQARLTQIYCDRYTLLSFSPAFSPIH